MTPIWIFPAYPLLIVGPHAGQLAKKVVEFSPESALQIIVGGFIIQGIGFMVSLMIYSAFLYRLMTHKLPKESVRPGMFVSIGPSGFTIAGIITMGQTLPKAVSKDFMGPGLGDLVGKVGMICANWIGMWLWGLAFWFLIISVFAHFSSAMKGKIHFAMTFYSFVFPNTALTTATFAVDLALGETRGVQILGCVLAVAVVLTWCWVFIMMIRAVKTHHILWPQRQEDRNEGGWVEGDERLRSVDREREVSMRRASAKQRLLIDEVQAARKKLIQEELVPTHDRADYAIKEAMTTRGQTRGRRESRTESRTASRTEVAATAVRFELDIEHEAGASSKSS
jgi:hypothetical protein